MEAQQEPEKPESGTEAEDIPSDFFDEFSKEEFIEGLSIIDSWDEGVPKSERSRNSSKISDSVINPAYSSTANDKMSNRQEKKKKEYSQSPVDSHLDEFIKPGSRRDPNKTNKAIKRDKEEKVKEYLAKSLESSDDLRPPGTELDGYFDETKQLKKDKTPITENFDSSPQPRSRSRERRNHDSPLKSSYRLRDSPLRASFRPRWSPRRSPRRNSPRRFSPVHRSPRAQPWRPYSPSKNFRGNFHRRSSPFRRSPRRHSPRRSPRRSSPRRSPRRLRRTRSRSPYKRFRRSRSPISKKHTDRFLYPTDSDLPPNYSVGSAVSSSYHLRPNQYQSPVSGEFSGGPSYGGQYGSAYSYNPSSYEYGSQSVISRELPTLPVPGPEMPLVPRPIPPISNPVSAPMLPSLPPNPVPAPMMVPAPKMVSPNMSTLPLATQAADAKTPYDALAKLVAEGKISKADYLKLAPNKGTSNAVENKQRVMVLQRCSQALHRLAKLHLPNHLLMNNSMLDAQTDAKYIAPKYCSPLKRQAPIEFLFTKANVAATAQQNKHLVDSIIASLPELEKVISRPKKKTPKNMKDAAVQTSKPYCDICEIRENTQLTHVSISTDPDHFCSTVHTQVVEQDLINSKSIFNPSGSVGDGAQMSIAHLTPAQLVSQLAARAKTLKQTDPPPPSQYQRNASDSYNYEGRGGQQYQNYSNYRY